MDIGINGCAMSGIRERWLAGAGASLLRRSQGLAGYFLLVRFGAALAAFFGLPFPNALEIAAPMSEILLLIVCFFLGAAFLARPNFCCFAAISRFFEVLCKSRPDPKAKDDGLPSPLQCAVPIATLG
jgi:hypothetical protein